ncbi:MAG: magnesium/cobalt transporter CorA [Bacteroidales bacterium]|nr:magnesium/cobalt transporter CorA [Bacteroidales bacterium]
MARFIKRRGSVKGSRPGSLILIGEQHSKQVEINVIQFDQNTLAEKRVDTVDAALSMVEKEKLTWINIYGVHDPEVIAALGKRLDIDDLLLEDIMNTGHRPVFNQDEDQLYIIAKLLSFNQESRRIEADQLSLIVADHLLISLQEKPGTHFDMVRERIRKSRDRKRIIHPDYLAYALLDCMVDTYMDLLADIGSSIDAMEGRIFGNPDRETSREIYLHRTELNFLRQTVLPMKEVTFGFLKSASPVIRQETRDFITDLHDHVVITHESIEVYYSLVADQLDIYHSMISNRANEIMKVLTIFAAIFIPLTFIAGIYGMNFENIPELKWANGYLYFWLLIMAVGILLLIYFKRKKWM